MNRCPSCAADVAPEYNYCRECGTAIDHATGGTGSAAGEHRSASGGQAGGQGGAAADQPPAPSGGRSDDGSGLVTRRNLLIGAGAVAGLVGFGGCMVSLAVLGEPDHAVSGDAWDVTRDESRRSETLTGELTLPAGRYAARELNPQVEVDYEVEFDVTSGGAVDVFTMEDDEYDRYRDRADDFQFLTGLSATDSDGDELTGTLGPGNYKLVVDNTGVYGADPDGEVELDIFVAGRA